jgi:hypothetical protein
MRRFSTTSFPVLNKEPTAAVVHMHVSPCRSRLPGRPDRVEFKACEPGPMDLWEGYWEVRSCHGDSDKPGLGPRFTIWLRRVGIRLSLIGDRRHQPLQRYVEYTVGARYHIATRSRYHVSDGRFVHEALHQYSQSSANMLLLSKKPAQQEEKTLFFSSGTSATPECSLSVDLWQASRVWCRIRVRHMTS